MPTKKKLRLIPNEPDSPEALGDRNVNMSTDLVMAAQGFRTIAEKRIIAACISKLDSISLDNHGRYRVKLTAAEYAATYPGLLDDTYDLLKKATRLLRLRSFRYTRKTGRIERECEHAWVTGAEYIRATGTVEIFFNVEATPLLLGLRGKYAGYLLKQAGALRTLTSWRLLEMLSRFKDTGWLQVSVDDFAKAMEAKPTYLKNFAQLRRWIIEPAVKELTEKDAWLIEWTPIKTGVKVTALRFTFKRDPQQRLDLDHAHAVTPASTPPEPDLEVLDAEPKKKGVRPVKVEHTHTLIPIPVMKYRSEPLHTRAPAGINTAYPAPAPLAPEAPEPPPKKRTRTKKTTTQG